MTSELISPPLTRRGISWAGRASQHRRRQVRAGGPESDARVHHLWASLVEVLRSIDSPSSALLCTADGTPVVAYGLPRAVLKTASRQAGTVFAAQTTAADGVETLELTSGLQHTVIASVPSPAQEDHLLSVTAEGVSLPLLEAWTRKAAEDLSELLTEQP